MGKGKIMKQGAPMPRTNSVNSQNALQQLQQKMLQTQELLATETVEVSAGGGAVKIVGRNWNDPSELNVSVPRAGVRSVTSWANSGPFPSASVSFANTPGASKETTWRRGTV